MALKSYRLNSKRKASKPKRQRRSSDTGNLLRQGTTAIIGVSLLGATVSAVNRI